MTTIQNLIEARRADKEDEGGFTLIELLIVIVVLGILAAIVVFAVQNLTGTSATNACKADFKQVEVAVEARKAQLPAAYATTAAELTTASGTPTVGPWLRSFPANGPRYAIALADGAATVVPPTTGEAAATNLFPAGTVLVKKGTLAAAGNYMDLNKVATACDGLP